MQIHELPNFYESLFKQKTIQCEALELVILDLRNIIKAQDHEIIELQQRLKELQPSIKENKKS